MVYSKEIIRWQVEFRSQETESRIQLYRKLGTITEVENYIKTQ